jgi:hypothetical protein
MAHYELMLELAHHISAQWQCSSVLLLMHLFVLF